MKPFENYIKGYSKLYFEKKTNFVFFFANFVFFYFETNQIVLNNNVF